MRAAVYVRLSKEDQAEAPARGSRVVLWVQQKNAERAIEAQRPRTSPPIASSSTTTRAAQRFCAGRSFEALLLGAERRAFDVLVLRDLDRLARDAARRAALLVQLEDAGVPVWTYSDRTFVAARRATATC